MGKSLGDLLGNETEYTSSVFLAWVRIYRLNSCDVHLNGFLKSFEILANKPDSVSDFTMTLIFNYWEQKIRMISYGINFCVCWDAAPLTSVIPYQIRI